LTGGKIRGWFRAAGFRRIERVGHGAEVGLGLFPWIDHRKTPDAIRFRLQKAFAAAGPGIAAVAPGASLHNFWRMDAG